MEISAHIIVKGLVQGVGFRWFVEREANKLNLKGFVRNLPNGDVETEVEGEKGFVDEFVQQLKIGNPMSRVNDVIVTPGEFTGKYSDFQIRF
ncbi:MAG: acylphosphatase [Calditrichaeota bacterium]|nr:acylphosphatase [Calditrichota bacterium]